MNRSRMFAALAAVLLCLVVVAPVLAATVVSESTYDLELGDTVEGNLYVFAGNVTIKGRVTGDLVATGSVIEIDDTGVVEGDVLAAGQGVEVRGQVQGDVRAAAFNVEVDGNEVGGDLAAAAFSIAVGEDASIGGDMLAAGYQGLLDGNVAGDVKFMGSAFELNGSVEGDVEVHVDAPEGGVGGEFSMQFMPAPMQPPRWASPGLEVSEDATVGGSLTYYSPSEVSLPDGVVAGETTFEPVAADGKVVEEPEEVEERSAFVEWLIDFVQEYLSLLIVGAVLVAIAPLVMGRITAFLAARPLPSFGWGCLTVIVAGVFAIALPFVAVLAAAAFGLIKLDPLVPPVLASGCLLGTVLSLGLYLLTWVAAVVVGLWIGRTLTRGRSEEMSHGKWLALLIGMAVIALLVTLPYIGPVLKVLIALLGLGAIVVWMWRTWTGLRAVTSDVIAGTLPTDF